MRYQEALELIFSATQNFGLSFPITENLIYSHIDYVIDNIGLRVVRKKDTEEFTSSSGTTEYLFTKNNVTNQIFRVQFDEILIPFVSKKDASALAASKIQNNSCYYDENVDKGVITAGTSANPINITDVAHGLVSNEKVKISEIAGLLLAAGSLSGVNGMTHNITKIDVDNFTIPVDGSAYAVAYSSGGVWRNKTKKIVFIKTPDSGKTITVNYYAKPEPRNSIVSDIDLPDGLENAAVHYTLARLLKLDSKFQLASGHSGIAKKYEDEYFDVNRNREIMPDIIPLPLQTFGVYE